MSLSQAEIYTLALGTGMSAARAKVAAAIAMAESGGDENAHNSKPPDDSYGLWQINMLGTLGPSRRAHFHLSSNEQLFDPHTNAAAMYSISLHGGNFNPWSTYTDGAYRKYINNAVNDVSKGDEPGFWTKVKNWDPTHTYAAAKGLEGGVVTTASAAGDAVAYLGKTAAWLSDAQNWLRVAYVGIGGVVVVAGLVMVLSSTQSGSAVVKTARKVSPL